ncbi:MAG: response regulator transcription factor [Terrimicrobiaceae bacterium]|nr:response regulator transcription factor [Terrimicrobiaceae bacterium]
MTIKGKTEGVTGPILVVDDQISVRELMAGEIVRMVPNARVEHAESGLDGLRMARSMAPVLVVLGLILPGMSGAELIALLRDELAFAKVLVFTGTRNREMLFAGLRARPHGFVHKTEPLETFREAVLAVLSGKTFLGPFATRLSDEAPGELAGRPALPPKLRTVLQLIAEGASTKEVAVRLAISPKTVEHYRTQLAQKLGLRDVASLTRYAVRTGLVD